MDQWGGGYHIYICICSIMFSQGARKREHLVNSPGFVYTIAILMHDMWPLLDSAVKLPTTQCRLWKPRPTVHRLNTYLKSEAPQHRLTFGLWLSSSHPGDSSQDDGSPPAPLGRQAV